MTNANNKYKRIYSRVNKGESMIYFSNDPKPPITEEDEDSTVISPIKN